MMDTAQLQQAHAVALAASSRLRLPLRSRTHLGVVCTKVQIGQVHQDVHGNGGPCALVRCEISGGDGGGRMEGGG